MRLFFVVALVVASKVALIAASEDGSDADDYQIQMAQKGSKEGGGGSAHRYELSDGGKLRLGGGEGGGGLRRTWGRGSGRAGKKGRRIREAGKALFNRIASTNRKNGGSGGFGQYDSGDESGDMEMTEEGNPLMNVRI